MLSAPPEVAGGQPLVREAPEKPLRLGHNKRVHALERPTVDLWHYICALFSSGSSPPVTGGHGVGPGSSAVVAPWGT